MRLKHKKLCLIIVLFVLMTSIAAATGPLYNVTRETKITRKLLRGTLNISFSFVEIPLEMNKEIKKTDYFTGFWVGLAKGTIMTWKRAATGAWEVLTFPLEIPKDYRPLIEPEFPLMDVVD